MSELHPAGMFDASVSDHSITKAKTGTPMLTVKFKTEVGTVYGRFAMSKKAIEYTIEKALAMGFRGDSLEELGSAGRLVGNRCVILVKHEPYEGKDYAKCDGVWPVGYEGKRIEKDEGAAKSAKQFDALLRKMKKDAPQVADTKPSAPSAPDAALDSKIPF